MTENNSNQAPTDTEPSSEELFALIGNEIRVEIIRALGDSRLQKGFGHVLSFSELRSRIDPDLDPSQLSYHIQKLVDHYVEKTDGGYALRSEGIHLYSALRAGLFERQEKLLSVAAGFDCYYCQTMVEAMFSGRRAKVECPDCEYRYLTNSVIPPFETLDGEAELFNQFSKYIHHQLLGYARGICQICGSVMGTEFATPEEVPGSGTERSKVYVVKSCNHCGGQFYLFIGVALLADSELTAFCYKHSIDVLSTPFWEFEFAATDKHVTVRSTDPWEVALAVTFDGDTLRLVVDGNLNVIERNQLDAPYRDEVSLPGKEACLEHLRRQRWPDGVTCPHCDSVDTIKKGKSKTDVQRYRCHTCDTIFNDLTGTIFAEHKLSLPEMLYIIREMRETKTARIVRQLDRSYPAVLNFMDEVREARDADTEFELVEFDETDTITASPEEDWTE